MKKIFVLSIILIVNCFSQQNKKELVGNITFVTSNTIYVKFIDTKSINIGDTLYVKKVSLLTPSIIVKFKSSKSVSGINISNQNFNQGDEIIALIREEIEEKRDTIKTIATNDNQNTNTLENFSNVNKPSKSKVYGFFNINSFSNRSNINNKDYQNWRMNFSFNADSIFNNGINFTSYLNFSYRVDQWNIIKNNLGNYIKFYDFALSYNYHSSFILTFGRKINQYTSSLGAIDGLQFEKKLGNFNLGLILGSRPNFIDYGFNFKLFEYGSYINFRDSIGKVDLQSSFGIFNQTNNFKTDRRFLYFQNFTSINNFSWFFSTEFDLYKKINEKTENVFNLTSTFININYRPTNWLNFSTSYDIRKNIFYFETYKTYIDSLIEASKRQGLTFRINLRPTNFLWINSNYSSYKSKNDIKATENYGMGFYIPSLPIILSNLNLSFNKLNTLYVNSDYYNFSLYKDLLEGKLNSGINLKYIKYKYLKSNYISEEKILGFDLYYSISKLFNIFINYEGTFQNKSTYWRTYLGLNTRF